MCSGTVTRRIRNVLPDEVGRPPEPGVNVKLL